MMNELLKIITDKSLTFETCLKKIDNLIKSCINFNNILEYIGIIPESIPHDSTEEKLWAKASDIALSYAFKKLGMKSSVLHTRTDSADVIAESIYHDYTLVADAKSFRLSRTAKNQKDFKVVSLSNWRQDSNYAILCSPYFQYPSNHSQIYKQAIEHNVCLFSWEYLIFLIQHNIKEDFDTNISYIWDFSYHFGKNEKFGNLKQCFLPEFNKSIAKLSNQTTSDFESFLDDQIKDIKSRGKIEIAYWESEKEMILSYNRKRAIDELIKSKKINEKISQITTFISGLD